MFIKIDDQYAIASDQNSWSIKTKKSRKHRHTQELIEEWKPIRWYSSFDTTVSGLAELMLRMSDAQTLTQALEEVKRIVATLSNALPRGFEVVAGKD